MSIAVIVMRPEVPHWLTILGSSYLWTPICVLAALWIVRDWRVKRAAVVKTFLITVIALMPFARIYAAEVLDPYYYCTVPPISEYPWIVRVALGCW